ncbi:RNA polymerase sigma factor [Nonomuraea endophytica]|uniref:RNA polymerase sigma-70 factor (ECF subfamily) n=1 Tax=Nonomuraea endophytica TaxID=714136 RepID=A0A7W8AA37_9ACTN|nr:RNA polymerase sigma factor [Nonomuraea endophytica]MBB5081018.1 RNA polymerase sigma-70 factor (ECF subfamily) [Nonomuraea endophytica]
MNDVERAQVLDEKEFAALYDATHPRVFAYAVSRCGRQLAEEVVSETFAVAWRRRADIPRRAVLPWLLGVARNVTRELYRDEVRQAALENALRGWAKEVTGDVAEEVARRSAVLSALVALSDEDKELLTLVSWHGLSSAQAARVVGCSVSAFFVRLHRARRRLEAALLVPKEEEACGGR